MAGALRRAGGSVLAALGRRVGAPGGAPAGGRGNHDLAVHNNKHIEQWLSRREDIEREFVWNGRTVRDVVVMALLVPIAMYNALTWRAHADDEYGQRASRDFLWSHAQPGERQG
ncbi:hypothetical protein HT031_001959 [Scenedesmus sp. PABB004]|nr:hypothetical protein HT031_001959 [Scenedesmus sp. PABB004]